MEGDWAYWGTTSLQEETKTSDDDLGKRSIYEAGDNLHDVIEKVVERIRKEIKGIQKRDSMGSFDPLQHRPPADEPFPEEVMREHVDYINREIELQSRKDELERRQKYDRILGCIPEDRLEYTFDRKRTCARRRGGFEPSSKSSVPTKKWLSILNTSEDEQAKAEFAARINHVGKRFAKAASRKLEWVENSKINTDHRLKRLEHILALVQEEQKKELARELALFEIKVRKKEVSRQDRHNSLKIAMERMDTSDMLMRLLDSYKLISGKEMAQYLQNANSFFEQQVQLVHENNPQLFSNNMKDQDSEGQAVTEQKKTLLEQASALQAIRRRERESRLCRRKESGNTIIKAQRTKTPMTRKQGKPQHFGGIMGKRLPFEAEQILYHTKSREIQAGQRINQFTLKGIQSTHQPSHRRPELPRDSDADSSFYSHIFNRSVISSCK